jgi:hypothetical protein
MEKFFLPMPKGDSKVLEAKTINFLGIYGMSIFELLFIGELGT